MKNCIKMKKIGRGGAGARTKFVYVEPQLLSCKDCSAMVHVQWQSSLTRKPCGMFVVSLVMSLNPNLTPKSSGLKTVLIPTKYYEIWNQVRLQESCFFFFNLKSKAVNNRCVNGIICQRRDKYELKFSPIFQLICIPKGCEGCTPFRFYHYVVSIKCVLSTVSDDQQFSFV